MGKVLIACEESQTECKAFRDRGYEAYSCDIQEPSGGHPEWHISRHCRSNGRPIGKIIVNSCGWYSRERKERNERI